jgi:hypothetical protein
VASQATHGERFAMITTITYEGPPVAVSALAQMLREEGVDVGYKPPQERRGGGIAEEVVVGLLCNGLYAAMTAGVQRFRDSRFGRAAKVTLPPEDQGEDLSRGIVGSCVRGIARPGRSPFDRAAPPRPGMSRNSTPMSLLAVLRPRRIELLLGRLAVVANHELERGRPEKHPYSVGEIGVLVVLHLLT